MCRGSLRYPEHIDGYRLKSGRGRGEERIGVGQATSENHSVSSSDVNR